MFKESATGLKPKATCPSGNYISWVKKDLLYKKFNSLMAFPLTENRSTARSAGVSPGVFGKIPVNGLEAFERMVRGREDMVEYFVGSWWYRDRACEFISQLPLNSPFLFVPSANHKILETIEELFKVSNSITIPAPNNSQPLTLPTTRLDNMAQVATSSTSTCASFHLSSI